MNNKLFLAVNTVTEDKASIAINTTIVGLLVVFLALTLLSILIYIFGKAMGIKTQKATTNINTIKMPEVANEVPAVDTTSSDNNDELIAVLTAAIMSSMKGSSECGIIIKSYRRISQHAPSWNTAGRTEYISGKL